MTDDELADWIAEHPDDVIPLVGAGLTIPAGAPAPSALLKTLIARVPLDGSGQIRTLGELALRASEAEALPNLREALADVITGLRLRPTPALTALSGVSARRILTTNYDDGLERAATARGLEVSSLFSKDREGLRDPRPGQLQVIHLHGLPRNPDSLVLPGATTDALDDDDVFTTFTRTALAARSVVFLGFSLAMEEVHLHHILRWLSHRVPNSPRHFLLLPADEAERREHEMKRIAAYGNVSVVLYEPDRAHSAAERVALAFAPRAGRRRDRDSITWVAPLLLRHRPDEDREQLEARMRAIEGGWGQQEDLARPEDLLAGGASIVIAGPGAGKTTLLERLLHLETDRARALGRLRDFQRWHDASRPERAITRLLHIADGGPFPVGALEDPTALLLLDGLDETAASVADQVLPSIIAAIERWPQASWVISSRPGNRADAFIAQGLSAYRIPASRAWARTYLQTRSVPTSRIEQALLDGYGLGDLLCVPLFAERIADRLLDQQPQEPIGPLELLIDEQYAAAAREADRHGYLHEALGEWLRWLAVSLELSGRVSADSDDLAAISAPEDGDEVRTALVEATLLTDRPGLLEFPAKPLQEGLCADLLLRADDPVALLREVAVADLFGVPTFRDDLDVTVDLVFENASPRARSVLRDLDEQRWARTAARTADEPEAAQALDVILAFHAEHGLALGWGLDGGLRTPRAAVLELLRRWPTLLDDRADQLEQDLCSESPAARSRALTLLSMAEEDPRLASRVSRALTDPDKQVAIDAATIAGRLRLGAAHDRLLGMLEDQNERTRAAALNALVEIAPVETLPAIAASVKGDGLRFVAPRMLERLDLDNGLKVVAAGSQLGGTEAWMLDRLIETAHPDAWSPERVHQVATCLNRIGGAGQPNLDLVAGVLAQHPQAALNAVHVRNVNGRPWGPLWLLLAIGRLDLESLGHPPGTPLWLGVEHAREEQVEIHARQHRHEIACERLAETLDRRGGQLDPQELEMPARRLDVQPRHQELLLTLVDQWWPDGPLQPDDPERHLPVRTSAALRLGVVMAAPLMHDRWEQLLDAHLRAGHWPTELGDDRVTSWLADTYEQSLEAILVRRISQARDGHELSRLIAIGHPKGCDAIAIAAVDRLEQLGPTTSWWSNAVGLLTERAGADVVEGLLRTALSPDQRQVVISAQARQGDERARLEIVQVVTAQLSDGATVEPPHWFKRTKVDIDAVLELVEAALEQNNSKVLGFALGLLTTRDDRPALKAMQTVASRHSGRTNIQLEARRLARRVAGAEIRARLPETLADLVDYVRSRLEPLASA